MHSDFVEGTLVGVVSPVKAERRPEPETWSAVRTSRLAARTEGGDWHRSSPPNEKAVAGTSGLAGSQPQRTVRRVERASKGVFS